MENILISWIKQHQHLTFTYIGQDPLFHQLTGHFEILEDMNCCAPTQNVLFAFITTNKRKVMDTYQLIEFLKSVNPPVHLNIIDV